ncbi:MAG TPA: hypothetical protein VEG34_06210 [Thermoanaerobaculia bacterium]|nr:hypothetical protein [Thermoanaerobaculia bacterium]
MDEPTSPPPSATAAGEDAAADLDRPGDWRSSLAAIYSLELPVVCSACRQEIDQLYVVRLYRSKVNFVSSLPRSGRVLVCPKCRTLVPGELGGVL